jgi:hypothetical protein
MRQCVSKEGTVDFVAWREISESVTSEEFVQLERVAAFEAEMQWEQTDFYREWSPQNKPSPGSPAPTSQQEHVDSTPVAVQQATVQSPAEILRIIREARALAREAQRSGMSLHDDPVEWLAKMRQAKE